MRKTKIVGAISGGLVLLSGAFRGTAWAEETPASENQCKVTQEITVGYQAVSQDVPEAKFEEYGEVPDGTVIKEYRLKSENEKTQIDFQAKDVKQNNQSYDLRVNQGYKVKVDASWNQIPHLYSNEGKTLYTENSPGEWRLPDQIQSNLQALQVTSTASIPTSTFNTQFSSYSEAARPIELGIRDDKAHVGLGFVLSDRAKLDIGVTQDKILGHRAKGASFGFSHVVELPEPIDYHVYTLNAGSQYNTKDMQLGLNYAMSSFNNDVETMVWDNAKRLSDRANSSSGYVAGDQSSQGRMPLAPDNMYHNVAMNGGVNLPLGIRFTADGSLGYYRQNQNLVPYTINTALKPGSVSGSGNVAPPCDASTLACLPVDKANAKMTTWTQNYALTARPWHPLTLALRYRSYQLINQTTEVTFPGQVRFDAVWEDNAVTHETVENKRFEYRKDSLEGGADLVVLKPWTVGFKYGTEWLHRVGREVRDTTENTLTANTDLRFASWGLLRGKFVHAERGMDDFELDDYKNDAGVLIESPGLRRADVADRDRNLGRVQLELNPGPLSIAMNGSLSHDRYKPGKGDLMGGTTWYTNNIYGLLESLNQSAGVDLGWNFSDRFQLSTYYQYEEVTSEQRSNDNGAAGPPAIQDSATDWWLRTVERYQMAGIGMDWVALRDRLDCKTGYDLSYSQGETLIVSLGPSLSKTAPPDTQTRKQDVYIRTNVHVLKGVTLVFGYLFEKYDYTDFAVQNIPLVGGIAAGQNNIFLGDNTRSYNAHVGTVLVKYKF